MTFEEMYRAVEACDKTHDGSFYYGTHTVGVFCHPSCRSKTPRMENIVFFHSLLEAHERGFIPCKRCRPDLADYDPGLAVARKTKELIESHYCERERLADALKNLGVTTGRLAIIFKQQFGLSPLPYVNSLRAFRAQ